MFERRLVRIGSAALLIVLLLASSASAEDCELMVASAALSSHSDEGHVAQGRNGNIPGLLTGSWHREDDDGDPCWPLPGKHGDGKHGDDEKREKRPAWPDPHPDRYAIDLFGDGFGVKAALGRGTPGWQFAYTQIDSSTTDDDPDGLQVRLGLVYRIPEPFLLWHFYGGGGMSYTLPAASHHPYFLTGTEFLFLFWEQGYLFGEQDGGLHKFDRAGVRFRF